ncbi:MAG TPA: GIY-YIG nuclease family protein [Ferruginibacter sp.]|nr:GIY-YIG nuclease family protein [Ferruginibacter sp.]
MQPVIPTALWGRVRVPSGPLKPLIMSGFYIYMGYYVYIIQSIEDGSFYKGFSENPYKRFEDQNRGNCTYTSSKMPWELKYIEECSSKREALIREKNLKKASLERIKALIESSKNLLNSF